MLAWHPGVAAGAPDVRAGCKQTFTRAEFRNYARQVFSGYPLTRPGERRRLDRLVRCQRNHESRAAMRERRQQFREARANRRAKVLRMGNRGIALLMLHRRGIPGEWPCLDRLWLHESGWNHRARNPSSGAYGIPQALPASKMASHGRDWRTNPRTQIAWGLWYLRVRYGGPCGGWWHFQRYRWY